MKAFGPVPSRRLGRSVGINNIPAKTCSYACAYCQVGRTTRLTARRQAFYSPEEIFREVAQKVKDSTAAGEPIDYLTFVADGEPTLDSHLGRSIDLLKPLGIGIAVISNASLIGDPTVQQDLIKADWVSLKVDCPLETGWRKINRPWGKLVLPQILEQILAFGEIYTGTLVTESMLIREVNDDPETLGALAAYLARVNPSTAYLSIPIRPPWESWAQAPETDRLNTAYQILSEKLERVEYLIGYEGNAFAATGNAQEDLLSITAVHPMREDALRAFLARAKADWSLVDDLLQQGKLSRTRYRRTHFYLRRLKTSV